MLFRKEIFTFKHLKSLLLSNCNDIKYYAVNV